jgi:multimeric flavodoxin WrbA
MKIVGILGSPRPKSNTGVLLDAVLSGAREAGAEAERLAMAGLKMEFCTGCSQCHRLGHCRHDDDAETLKAKMREADGIVLGSPVYISSVTAQMKTLMDRCCHFIHCFLLDGKYGAAVATAGGSGQDEVGAYQNRFLRTCGAQTVGTAGALGAHPRGLRDEGDAVARATQLGIDLVAAITEKRDYPDQAAERTQHFARMKYLVSSWGDEYPAQHEYWRAKGWL